MLCFLGGYGKLYAQGQPTGGTGKIETATDTSKRVSPDTVAKVAQRVGDIETTILYNAKDSMRFDMLNKIVYLYGGAVITYGKTKLQADRIEINWTTNTLKAYGVADSTGKTKGDPVFDQEGESYTAKVINYNFKTEKGVVSQAGTKYGDGFIQGKTVKRMDDGTMYLKDGLYTTCDLPHPHFGIRSRKLKYIPGKLIVSGSFNLEIADVPTPLAFAFGMFPQPKKRASGFIMPQYGETRERGFFLMGGGFYWAASDFFDVKLTGEIHSRGGWGLQAGSSYNKLYAFGGSVDFRYNRRVNEIPGSLEKNIVNDFNLTWSHSPQSKGSTRFSANVNAGTNSFNRNNSFQTNNFQSSAFNSNISFSKTFTGTPFTFNANLRHEQNIITKVVGLFPDMNLGMNRIFPFKKKNSTSKSLLSQLSVSYTARASARLSNAFEGGSSRFPTAGEVKADTVKFAPENFGRIIENTQMGVQHAIPIGTSVTLAKFFNVSFSGNYSETWYTRRYEYSYNPDTKLVDIDTIRRFSRYYDYSTSATLNTQLYAFFYPKSNKVEALRMQMTPSISFGYKPDFGLEKFGFFEKVVYERQSGSTYVKDSTVEARFRGLYGQPQRGESGSISFSLANALEMKLKSKTDTAGKAQKAQKISVIDNFGFNTSYNLAADSFNLSPVSWSVRTNILKKFNFSLSGGLDPYTYVEQKPTTPNGTSTWRKINQYAWNGDQGLGTLTNVSMALSTNFAPPKGKKDLKSEKATQQELDWLNRNREYYVDFNVPWTLNLSYNLSYSRSGRGAANVSSTMNFNGDVQLTKKWKVGMQSGYDFKQKALSFTQFTIYRDLHCWQMNVSWIPFGPRAGYTLDINVRSSILQDLKLSRRNTWYFR
jgi:lipopolysaccharide assembly outer membrane protein LptD (OstA)